MNPETTLLEVKVAFGSDIRRFQLHEATMDAVTKKIQEVYGIKNMKKLAIRYLDSEGDYVTMATEEDFNLYKSRVTDSLFKLQVARVCKRRFNVEPPASVKSEGNVSSLHDNKKPKLLLDKEAKRAERLKLKLQRMQEKREKRHRERLMRQHNTQTSSEEPNIKFEALSLNTPHFKPGDVVTLCCDAQRTNREQQMGCYLAVNDKGELIPDGAESPNALWLISESQHLCLASQSEWHLYMSEEGAISLTKDPETASVFLPETQEDNSFVFSVHHEGKFGKFDNNRWYIGVTRDGLLTGQADPQHYLRCTMKKRQL